MPHWQGVVVVVVVVVLGVVDVVVVVLVVVDVAVVVLVVVDVVVVVLVVVVVVMVVMVGADGVIHSTAHCAPEDCPALLEMKRIFKSPEVVMFGAVPRQNLGKVFSYRMN